MPTEVGIHAFPLLHWSKAWMLTSVSMTRGQTPVSQRLRRLVSEGYIVLGTRL